MKSIKRYLILLSALVLFFAMTSVSPLEGSGFAEAVTDAVFDDFRSTRLDASNVYKSDFAVGDANSTHALLPAESWGDPVTTGSGYVIYKLSARRGYKISSLNLTLTALVDSFSNSLFNGNTIKIYYSTDGEVYNIYQTITVASGVRTFEYSAEVSPVFDLFIKLEMNNYPGELPLSSVGVKIYSIGFTYSQEVTDELREIEKSVLKDNYMDVANFSGEVFATENGVGFSGNGYYNMPLSLDTGVEITLTELSLLDHTEYDSWLSFAVLCEKKAGNYLDCSSNGLHFMFFVQGKSLKCNLVYTYNGVTIGLCSGMVIGSSSDKDIDIRISRKQFSKSRAMVVELNGITVSASLNSAIMNYKLCGGEGFAYIGFGAFGNNNAHTRQEMHSAVIGSISYADVIGPQISVNNLKESYSVGLIILPDVVITDSGDITYKRIRLFSPDGKRISVSSNKFTASVAGEYLLLVEAEDDSGNTSRSQFIINVA